MSNKIDNGGPVFPQQVDQPTVNAEGHITGWIFQSAGRPDAGMSVRTWLVGQALVGLLSNPTMIQGRPTRNEAACVAGDALMIADAAIAAITDGGVI